MPPQSYRLEPLPGYAPAIGRLVGILLFARHTTLAAVVDLSVAELDHLQDSASNWAQTGAACFATSRSSTTSASSTRHDASPSTTSPPAMMSGWSGHSLRPLR